MNKPHAFPIWRSLTACLGLAAIMVAAAAYNASAAVVLPPNPLGTPNTRYFRVHNSNEKNVLVKWSMDFSFPAGGKPTGYSVHRLNAATKTWIEETNKWKGTSTEPKTGSFHVNIDIKDAAAVPYCTWLVFDVSFNTNDVGESPGMDLKYKPDPCPKRAIKKSRDKIIAPDKELRAVGEIDSAVFYGGTTGRDVPELGLSVPANTYLYAYQVNALQGPDPLTTLVLPGTSFYQYGQLGNSHSGALAASYVSDVIPDPPDPPEIEPPPGPDDPTVATFDALGSPGVAALFWGPGGGGATATFGGLQAGQCSNIFWGLSILAPGLPEDRFNAALFAGVLYTENYVWTPIPEPSGLALLAGLFSLAGSVVLMGRAGVRLRR